MDNKRSINNKKRRSGFYQFVHAVESWLLRDDPACGLYGARSERASGVGLVLDLDALAFAGEQYRMIAHDIPASDGVNADLSPAGRDAMTAIDVIRFRHQGGAHDVRGLQRGAAGGVLLLVVVRLDDLDVAAFQILRRLRQ